MTATVLRQTPDTRTSAVGCMYRSGPDATVVAALIATILPSSVTANTYAQGSMAMGATIALCFERTAAGPAGQIMPVPAQSTAEAIMEIRRRSGLTWEELGDLFDVSRRSVHHWANGKPVTTSHDRMIHRMLAAVRHLDRGDQASTRALLLAVDQGMGVSALDLLKHGRFDEVMGRVAGVPALEPHRVPLSRAARAARAARDARRPQAPVLLLGAEQERPDVPARARAVRAKRTPKTTG